MTINNIKHHIAKKIKLNLDIKLAPNPDLGDFCIECFKLKPNPIQAAQKIANNMRPDNVIQSITQVNGYVNFKINNNILFESVCKHKQILPAKKNKKTIMVEYVSPNTNKPLHLGHIRNSAIGQSISNLLQASGYNVVQTCLMNDRGIHICKSMLAYKKWGNNATPKTSKMKPDHFVGKWYVKYNTEAQKNPNLETELKKMLYLWEHNDEQTIKLWKKMNNWFYSGVKQTYKILGLKFNKIYFESKIYQKGKKIIAQGIKNKIFKKLKDNTIIVKLKINNQDKIITLQRADNTSVYITQDLALTKQKFNDFDLCQSIWIIGSEQIFYFDALLNTLKLLKFKHIKQCKPIFYGMVYLPEGKMKSRQGKIVDADNLIAEMSSKTKNIKIGLSAIKFNMLSIAPKQDIHFNPQESISLNGKTGPYCQYAYVRCLHIIKKYKSKHKPDYGLLGNKEELFLLRAIIQFQDKITQATKQFNPSILANYVFELSKAFNSFYEKHNVLKTQNKNLLQARINLVKTTAKTLKQALNILGIDTVKTM